MFTAADFRQAYSEYVQFCRDLNAEIGPVGSILKVFGFNKKQSMNPEHERFFKEMEAAVAEVCKNNPDADTAASIIDVIYGARYTYKDEPVSPFMFIALEGSAIDLIPYLSKEKAEELYVKYKVDNPRYSWLPVQKVIFSTLKKAIKK